MLRIFISSFLLASTLMSTSLFAANDYPSKPIHIIVPLAAGSAIDNAVRILTQKMGENMGQSFVIENLTGAAGAIGADKVAKSAPDGYTLGGFNDSILTMVPHMQSKLTWDPIKDFEPISLAALVEWGLVVNPARPEKTVADLIASAKKNPGQINYGSGGNGSPQHIAMALMASQTGVTMTHVPYKGVSQAALGVAGGEVQTAFLAVASLRSLAESGKLRLIAVATPQRMPQFPNTPTIAESGVPGFEFKAWFAMVAPAGTPKPVIQKLNEEISKALTDPGVREKLNIQGLKPLGSSPEELTQAIKSQLLSYGKVIKKAGITSD